MAFRILVTARSFGKVAGEHHTYLQANDCEIVLHAAAHPLTAAELAPLIAGVDGVILGLDVCDASVIASADRLKVISRYGAGCDAVDLDAAARHGIAVTNTPGANAIGVAELTLGLMFALARRLPTTISAARGGEWLRPTGSELFGKTLGLVGFGMIGKEVAQRALALGLTVLTYDPYTSAVIPGVERVDLPDLLRRAHYVSLHAAATPETHDLINAERLALMREGAYLINTARGSLVDEDALYRALTAGTLAGAAVDALKADPPPADHPLLALPNFFYTPHIGMTTDESVRRVALLAAHNLVAVLKGDPCAYVVNAALLRQYAEGTRP